MIECAYLNCAEPASLGGLFHVQPNGMHPGAAVYYACDVHKDTLRDALQTWPVAS